MQDRTGSFVEALVDKRVELVPVFAAVRALARRAHCDGGNGCNFRRAY